MIKLLAWICRMTDVGDFDNWGKFRADTGTEVADYFVNSVLVELTFETKALSFPSQLVKKRPRKVAGRVSETFSEILAKIG